MLQTPVYLFLLTQVCSARPFPKQASSMVQKRGTPLASNPGAAVVFTIAIVLCLTIVIWAIRKHYQQKYAADIQASEYAGKDIPEVIETANLVPFYEN